MTFPRRDVLRHRLGQNLILGPSLLLHVFNPLLFRLRFGPSTDEGFKFPAAALSSHGS